MQEKETGDLPVRARAYVLSLCVAALAVAAHCASAGWPQVTGPFLFYLACGLICSKMKVWLPGITGTLSMNFLFVLVSATELSLPETIAVGCTSGVAQLFFAARKRPRPVNLLFVLASMTICSAVTYWAYRASRLSGSVPLGLLVGTSAYFLSNTLSVACIIALTGGRRIAQVWRENFFWMAPHYLVGGALAGLLHLCNELVSWQGSLLVLPPAFLVYHSYRLYLGRLEEEKRHMGEMADLHLQTIHSLALAIDARDGTTSAHLRRVQIYARELARDLGLTEEERRALDAAAPLHDIGKLAVPDSILSKPGKLTAEEFERIKVHPVVGAEILQSVPFPYPVAPIVRAHHERWDGSGYPDGLKGEQIPIGARIVAAVDCLDALASDRQYRRALSLDKAMEKIATESGTSFDPRVIEVLQRRYVEFEGLTRTQAAETSVLSTGVHIQKGGGPAAGIEPSDLATANTAAARPAPSQFQTLLELAQLLGPSLRAEETLALLASSLRTLIPHHGIAIYTLQGQHLVTRYAAGEDAELFLSLQIPLGEGISGWVLQNTLPVVNGNPSVEPGYLNDPSRFSVHRSALAIPLPGLNGVIGALTLYHREAGAFSQEHLRALRGVSSRAGLLVERTFRGSASGNAAATDALTGFGDARAFFGHLSTELKKAGQTGSRLALVVANVDGFQEIHERFGPITVNQVLEETAQALRRLCREGDYTARIRPDQFVLLLPGAGPESIQQRLERLEQLMADVGQRVCRTESLSLSTGVSCYPGDGDDAGELLAKADARMYERKRLHPGGAGALRQELTKLADAVESAQLAEPHRAVGLP